MSRCFLSICATVFCLLCAPSGNAQGGLFGKQESIHEIQGIEGTRYTLCYKTTTTFFILGVSVSDDGYVVQSLENLLRKEYIPANSGLIEKFQREGLLPTPLPPYSISLEDYLIGHSLWIALIVIVVGWIVVSLRKRAVSPEDTSLEAPATDDKK